MLIVYLFIDSTQQGPNLQFKPTTAPPAPSASRVFLPVQGRWGGPLSLPQPILEPGQQEEASRCQAAWAVWRMLTGVSQVGMWEILPPSEADSGVHVWKRSEPEFVALASGQSTWAATQTAAACSRAGRQCLLRPSRGPGWAG